MTVHWIASFSDHFLEGNYFFYDHLQLHPFGIYHPRFDFFRRFLELWGTSVVGFAVAVAEFAFRLMEIYSVVCHQSCSLTLLEQQWADCQQLLEARRTSFMKASSDLHSSLHYLMLCCFVVILSPRYAVYMCFQHMFGG